MATVSTDERDALRQTVRTALERESDPRAAVALASGYDEKLWRLLCGQLGVAGLAVPEEFAGLGAGLPEMAAVAEELGRTLTPAPFLGSVVLATGALLATGNETACARLLPAMLDGRRIASLVWADEHARWDVEAVGCHARHAAGSYTVDGHAHYVLDGDNADTLLVLAHLDDDLALFEVDPAQSGVQRRWSPTMDQTRRLAEVELTGAGAERLDVGGFATQLGQLRDTALVALAAEQVGAAARALELTVAYTQQREQFGRPIGGFQALKHRMADLHVLVETARSIAYAAADATVPSEFTRLAAAAKVHCSEAFDKVAAEMIQLHGGIAITWEHDAHLYFKRAHASAQLFGQPHEHLARFVGLSNVDR